MSDKDETRTKILEAASENPDATPEQLAELVGVHHTTVRRHLKEGAVELDRLRESQNYQRAHEKAPDEAPPEPEQTAPAEPEPGTYTTRLKPRHAAYLERYAAMQGIDTGRALEKLVREKMASDPTKAGMITPNPEAGATSFKAADKGKYQ